MVKCNTVKSVLFVMCFSFPAAFVVAEEQPRPQMEMAQFYLGLIYKGDNWGSIQPADAAEIQKGHRANIDRLIQTG